MNRARFPKLLDAYKALNFFGENIVTTEGEDWKRHRKPVAPSFSDVRRACGTRAAADACSPPSATTSSFGTRRSTLFAPCLTRRCGRARTL